MLPATPAGDPSAAVTGRRSVPSTRTVQMRQPESAWATAANAMALASRDTDGSLTSKNAPVGSSSRTRPSRSRTSNRPPVTTARWCGPSPGMAFGSPGTGLRATKTIGGRPGGAAPVVAIRMVSAQPNVADRRGWRRTRGCYTPRPLGDRWTPAGGRGGGGRVTEMLMVFTTFANAEDAARAARTLVEERLVACANILTGVRSIYR